MADRKKYDVVTTSEPFKVPKRTKKVDGKLVEIDFREGMHPVMIRMLKRSKSHMVGDVCALPPKVAAGYVQGRAGVPSAEYVKPATKSK